MYHTAVGLAALPASLLAGWVWQAFGAPAAFMTGGALAGLAAIPLWGLLAATERRP